METAVLPASPPLEAFNLDVSAAPLAVSWNETALREAVEAAVAPYDGLLLDDDDVSAARQAMAALNRLRGKMEISRKQIVQQIRAPLDAFEDAVRRLEARIQGVRKALAVQVDALEAKRRKARRPEIRRLLEATRRELDLPPMDVPLPDRWCNESLRPAALRAEMESALLRAWREGDAASRRVFRCVIRCDAAHEAKVLRALDKLKTFCEVSTT